jgi:gluconate 2-dehydrogenase gamma chain
MAENPEASRRRFIFSAATGLSSAWVALHWPSVIQAHEHAREVAADPNRTLEFFSAADAAEIEAMAERIIPGDAESPGAREAGVVYFIDRALATFDRERQPLYKEGLAMLQARTREMFPGATLFSQLKPEQQIQLLTAIEKTDFFEAVRVHTIMGFLADPSYGGNRGQAGWKLIGFEARSTFKPPFGYYDAEENR